MMMMMDMHYTYDICQVETSYKNDVHGSGDHHRFLP